MSRATGDNPDRIGLAGTFALCCPLDDILLPYILLPQAAPVTSPGRSAQGPQTVSPRLNHGAVLNASVRTMPPAAAACQPVWRQMRRKAASAAKSRTDCTRVFLQHFISKSLTIMGVGGVCGEKVTSSLAIAFDCGTLRAPSPRKGAWRRDWIESSPTFRTFGEVPMTSLLQPTCWRGCPKSSAIEGDC